MKESNYYFLASAVYIAPQLNLTVAVLLSIIVVVLGLVAMWREK